GANAVAADSLGTVFYVWQETGFSNPHSTDAGTRIEGQAFHIVPFTKTDFNHDTFSEILWHNNSTGDTGYTDLNHGQFVSLGSSPANYSVAGTGDFNGDGNVDILWRNNATGDTGYSDIHNNQFVSLGGSPVSQSVVGVADFNGDGFADIL